MLLAPYGVFADRSRNLDKCRAKLVHGLSVGSILFTLAIILPLMLKDVKEVVTAQFCVPSEEKG